MALVVENFGPEVRKGLIDILAPDSDFYPDFDMIKVRDFIFSDDENRIKWRMKQNYDYSYLMTYCAQRGEFYIQLEDDIKSNDGFLTDIQLFMNLLSVENETRWLMLEFCNLGFIGKLVRTRDLQMFVNVFLMFAEIKPVDQLHNVVFEAISCNPEKAFV
jgi:alpha-1,3-mannosylglycoprotein beta-1,4-N-acetylglucosaminyltransferase A/B